MMQYKIPIIILVLLLLVGAGFSFYRGGNFNSSTPSLPSNQKNNQSAPDLINYLAQNGVGADQSNDKTPLTVTVSDAVVEFVLEKYDGNGPLLNYSLEGPKLTLNSNKSATINGTVEIYDDTNKLATSNNINNIYLQKGNQVVTIPFGITLHNQGKYSVFFKLSTKDEKEIYSKNFNDLLVGTSVMPINKSVSLQAYDIKTTEKSGTATLYFSLKAKNTGNTDLLGYYKIETSVNGVNKLGLLYWGFDNVGSCGGGVWNAQINTGGCTGGRLFIPVGSEYISDYSSDPDGAFFLNRSDCTTGDKIDVKVSFMESIAGSPMKEGKALGIVKIPTQTCIGD